MSRYIDADLLVRWICGNKCGCERNECGFTIPCQQVQTLEGAPSIEIIRCEECKRANYEWSGVRCGLSDALMGEDGFCSIGERRESRDR